MAKPIGGVGVTFGSGSETTSEDGALATTELDGSFELTAPATARRLVVDDPTLTTVMRSAQVPQGSGAEAIVVAAPAIALRGKVVDPVGVAISEARIELRAPASLRARIGAVLDHSEDVKWIVETDEHGMFELAAAPAIADARLVAHHGEFSALDDPAPQASRDDLVLILQPQQAQRMLEGVVIDQRGAPVEGASVSMGVDTTKTDARGEFSFDLDAEKTFNKFASRFMKVEQHHLMAVKAGHHPGRTTAELDADGNPLWAERVVLELGGEPRKLGGTRRRRRGRATRRHPRVDCGPDVLRRPRGPGVRALPRAGSTSRTCCATRNPAGIGSRPIPRVGSSSMG